jgi:hypothetical protein
MKLNYKIFATASALAAAAVPGTANADVPQDVLNNVIANILQNIRDQIQSRRLVVPVPGRMQFTGEEVEFSNRDPFAVQGASNPFAALAYAKAPTMAAPPSPAWIYGANLIGSGDKTYTFNGLASTTIWSATAVGAFDATKIGVFTATDAITFVLTGSNTWAHTFSGGPLVAATWFDSGTPSASGTISYINGGFSADFTASASWTHSSSDLALAAPADSSAMTYTGNAQYRFDFPYHIFFEPTGGVTYTEIYTMNFGTKTGDTTEVHAGGRVGTEMQWMGFTVQPSISGAVFRNVDCSGTGCGTGGLPPGFLFPGAPAGVAGMTDLGLGGRGSAKINVIWTPHFSTYVEAHGSGYAGTKNQIIPATQTMGAQAGARYTW